MRLFGYVDGDITSADRAEWLTPPFNKALLVASLPGLDYTLPNLGRCHFTLLEARAHYTLPELRAHYTTLADEDWD